ncbi:HAMP domain-containing protein [bacterium]|nr:HAMP domain-containing protein [bacterium]
MLTVLLPLEQPIRGREAVMGARINLKSFIEALEAHPFNRSGEITLVNADGEKLFVNEQPEGFNSWPVVEAALNRLQSETRSKVVSAFDRPDGETMLAALDFPLSVNWAVIVEENVKNAYIAITRMIQNLFFWIGGGLLVAIAAGIMGAQTLSRPILEITRVASSVGKGNLETEVQKWVLKSRDEIGDLGRRMNDMIEGLRERLHLTKFVSESTVDAIRRGRGAGIKLGGERREITVFFSDIRGFTAFSEKVEPEVVIDMLNTYLSVQAELVRKHHGDVDKYVGDELVAVFQGRRMVMDAVRCAVDIQEKMGGLNAEHPEWNIGIGIGINTGPMILGAMGSEDRMDYTILGDNVNLGARLCSHARREQILISPNTYEYLKEVPHVELEALEPIKVKGKEQPIQIYNVTSLKMEARMQPAEDRKSASS